MKPTLIVWLSVGCFGETANSYLDVDQLPRGIPGDSIPISHSLQRNGSPAFVASKSGQSVTQLPG
jgi:hypothetical protein